VLAAAAGYLLTPTLRLPTDAWNLCPCRRFLAGISARDYSLPVLRRSSLRRSAACLPHPRCGDDTFKSGCRGGERQAAVERRAHTAFRAAVVAVKAGDRARHFYIPLLKTAFSASVLAMAGRRAYGTALRYAFSSPLMRDAFGGHLPWLACCVAVAAETRGSAARRMACLAHAALPCCLAAGGGRLRRCRCAPGARCSRAGGGAFAVRPLCFDARSFGHAQRFSASTSVISPPVRCWEGTRTEATGLVCYRWTFVARNARRGLRRWRAKTCGHCIAARLLLATTWANDIW